ncbi:MAG: diguanylate cyclase [Sulfurimonas sp.]|nr:diguanylate cyclase [Sulfurimonas sp.]
MNISIKNQTLLFISSIFIIFSGIFLTIVYTQTQHRLKLLELENFENIKSMHNKLINKEIEFYTNRINANINSNGVRETLLANDAKKLYQLSLGRYEILKSENLNFISMNFYTQDGHLLLKMNDKNADVINAGKTFRLLQEVQKEKKQFSGFEVFENVLAFRIIRPIFNNEKYIGAIEFSIQVEYILNQMDEYYGVEGVLFVKNQNFHTQDGVSADGFSLVYNILDSSKLLSSIINIESFDSIKKIKVNFNEIYSTYAFNITDKDENLLAKIVFAKNITKELLESEKDLNNIALLLAFALIITLILVNIGFNKSIKKLESNYGDVTQYKNLIDNNLITLSTDLYGSINEVSDAFCDLSKFSKEELLGINIKSLLHTDISRNEYNILLEALKSKFYWSGEIKQQKQDGYTFWVDANIQPKFKNNKIVGYDTVMHNITEKKINEELMITDGLTHIYNRRYFNDVLPRIINSVKRDGGFLTLVVLDIDHFKEYNDTYGHMEGDNTLIDVAHTLKNSLKRPDDYCFRLGGEEFALLYKNTNESDAKIVVENVRQNILKLGIKHENNSALKIVTASFGVVTLRHDILVEWDKMYTLADDKMYAAKKSGRNAIEF